MYPTSKLSHWIIDCSFTWWKEWVEGSHGDTKISTNHVLSLGNRKHRDGEIPLSKKYQQIIWKKRATMHYKIGKGRWVSSQRRRFKNTHAKHIYTWKVQNGSHYIRIQINATMKYHHSASWRESKILLPYCWCRCRHFYAQLGRQLRFYSGQWCNVYQDSKGHVSRPSMSTSSFSLQTVIHDTWGNIALLKAKD